MFFQNLQILLLKPQRVFIPLEDEAHHLFCPLFISLDGGSEQGRLIRSHLRFWVKLGSLPLHRWPIATLGLRNAAVHCSFTPYGRACRLRFVAHLYWRQHTRGGQQYIGVRETIFIKFSQLSSLSTEKQFRLVNNIKHVIIHFSLPAVSSTQCVKWTDFTAPKMRCTLSKCCHFEGAPPDDPFFYFVPMEYKKKK